MAANKYSAARRKIDPRTPKLKQEATSRLEACTAAMSEHGGTPVFSLDVTGLARKERNKVRMHVNRWLRVHGWFGETHYVDEERESLTVKVLGRREEEAQR